MPSLKFTILAFTITLAACNQSQLNNAENLATVCEGITMEKERDGCFMAIANQTLDVSFCEDKIVGVEYRNRCYQMIAMRKYDSSLCDKITDESKFDRNDCYRLIAVKNNNPSLCEKITGQWQNDCYAKIAMFYKEPIVCRKITEESARNYCESYIKDHP